MWHILIQSLCNVHQNYKVRISEHSFTKTKNWSIKLSTRFPKGWKTATLLVPKYFSVRNVERIFSSRETSRTFFFCHFKHFQLLFNCYSNFNYMSINKVLTHFSYKVLFDMKRGLLRPEYQGLIWHRLHLAWCRGDGSGGGEKRLRRRLSTSAFTFFEAHHNIQLFFFKSRHILGVHESWWIVFYNEYDI
jgi:hypothetical protein